MKYICHDVYQKIPLCYQLNMNLGVWVETFLISQHFFLWFCCTNRHLSSHTDEWAKVNKTILILYENFYWHRVMVKKSSLVDHYYWLSEFNPYKISTLTNLFNKLTRVDMQTNQLFSFFLNMAPFFSSSCSSTSPWDNG